jgi:hypothetical protein
MSVTASAHGSVLPLLQTTDHEAMNYLAAISAALSVHTLSNEELGKWKKVLDRYPEGRITQALVDELQSIDAAGQVASSPISAAHF